MDKLLKQMPGEFTLGANSLIFDLWSKKLYSSLFLKDLTKLDDPEQKQTLLFERLIREGDGETYKIFKDVVLKHSWRFWDAMGQLERVRQQDC